MRRTARIFTSLPLSFIPYLVVFLLLALLRDGRRNIIHAVNITDKVNITCPQGQTSFQKQKHFLRSAFVFGGATRNRTGDKGFADLCLTAWLWRHIIFSSRSAGFFQHKKRTLRLAECIISLFFKIVNRFLS